MAHKTHVFLISTQENEDRFQIQISEVSVAKIKKVIRTDIIPKSIYRIPLETIGWEIHYIEKENRFIKLTDDAQLLALLQTSRRDPFPIQITFENEHSFQSWLATEQRGEIPSPDIIAVTVIPGALAINLQLPSNINMYSIHYQVQPLSQRNKRDILPSNIAYRSPIIIRNLWPYQSYRMRIRFKSKLFREQHSTWSNWMKSKLTVPPPLKMYNKANVPKQTEDRYKSRFETLDKRGFIEWCKRKLADDGDANKGAKESIWSTEFERRCIIPALLATISHKKCSLKAKMVLLKDPKQYIADVMQVYTKYIESKERVRMEKTQSESFEANTRSIAKRRLRRSKLQTHDQLKLKQLSDIIQIYNASTARQSNNNNKLELHDLLHYLRDEEIRHTVQSKGINIEQVKAMIESEMTSNSTATRTSSATISRQVDQHSFSSILWRLRQRVCRESSHMECECDNPYAVTIWIYFVKEPTKHRYWLYCDKKYVALEPCLNYNDCYLYRGTYYVRCDPFNVNLPFNLCEKGKSKPRNQKPIFLANDKKDNMMIESQKHNILIAKVYNDASALLYGEKRSDVVTKIKKIEDWNSLSIPRGFFHTNKEELEYLECMLHHLCANVGVAIPLSTAIATLNLIWSCHKDTKIAYKANMMIKKKLRVQRKMFTTKTVMELYNHPTWYSWSYIVAALFYLFYLFGTDEIHKEKKHKLFDQRMRSFDIFELLLNGKYGPPKRAFALLSCVLNNGVSVKHQIVNQFMNRIMDSISKSTHVVSKYQFALWYKLMNCAILDGKCSVQPKLATQLQHTSELSRQMIKLLRIDYNIEVVSKIPRTQPLERECLAMLRTHIQQHKHNRNHTTRGEIKDNCFYKMKSILSLFQADYCRVLRGCKYDIYLIIKEQYKPFAKLLDLYFTLRPKNGPDLSILSEYIADFVSTYSPKHNDQTLKRLVKLMREEEWFKGNEKLLRAMLYNDSLCNNTLIIDFMIPLLHQPKYKKRLREYYELFWNKYGLLLTFETLVLEKQLSQDIFIDVLRQFAERVSKMNKFEDWLELMVHKEISDDIKILLAEHPPITYQQILSEEFKTKTSKKKQYKHIQNKAKVDALEQTLVCADPNLFPDKHKPLAHWYKFTVCNSILEHFLQIDSKYVKCHEDDFTDISILMYYYAGYGKYYIQFIHRLCTSPHSNANKIPYCNRLLSNFKRWWQRLREKCSNLELSDSIISQLSGNEMYSAINDLYMVIGGRPNTEIDIKIDGVFKRYQRTQDIKKALNLFFSHFAPEQTDQWNADLRQLRIKQIELGRLTAKGLETFNWQWYDGYKTFFDDLLLYPDSSVFKQVWYDRIDEYVHRWSAEDGLKWSEMDSLDMCCWLESRPWTKQHDLVSIKTLQKLFIKKGITGKLLHQIKSSTSIDVPTDFVRGLHVDRQQETEFRPLISLLMLRHGNVFRWNKLYSMSIIQLLYETHVKPFWDSFTDSLKRKNVKVYYLQKYFQFKPEQIEIKKIESELKSIRIYDENDVQKLSDLTNSICNCLFCIQCVAKAKVLDDALQLFNQVLTASRHLSGIRQDKEYQALQSTFASNKLKFTSIKDNNGARLRIVSQQTRTKMDQLLQFWINHRKECMSMDCGSYGLRWLSIITQQQKFVFELFDLFEDDARFSSHLKLFQTSDPHQSIRLNKLSRVRNRLIKSIGFKLSGQTMKYSLHLFLKLILKKIKKADVERLDFLLEEWSTIKTKNERLEAIKFQQDRAQLHRLKAFRFVGKTLCIELHPPTDYNETNPNQSPVPELENSRCDVAIEYSYEMPDLPEATETNPPDHNVLFPPHSYPSYPDSPTTLSALDSGRPWFQAYDSAQSNKPWLSPVDSMNSVKSYKTNKTNKTNKNKKGASTLPPPPARDRHEVQVQMHYYPSMNAPPPMELMSSDKFISLHDRLLIYTSTGNSTIPPYLGSKGVDQWDNDDVIKFYQNEMKGSRTVIDEQYYAGILNILRKTGINGVELRDCHHSLQDFQAQIFCFDVMEETQLLFDGDRIQQELVANELLKIIQLYIMRKQVSDIVPKFEIAKKIQKLRITYYEQGGRDHLPIYASINIFDQTYEEYESILSKWKFYHYRWKKMISDLRVKYKLLSYYTVQDMRFICQESCNYKLYMLGSDKKADMQSCAQKLRAKFAFIKRTIPMEHTVEIVQKWENLDGTIYFKELRKRILQRLYGDKPQADDEKQNEEDAFPDHEIMYYATLRSRINIYLELEAYQDHEDERSQATILNALVKAIAEQLRELKAEWSLDETYKLLSFIEPYDERLIFGTLGTYLIREFEAIVPLDFTISRGSMNLSSLLTTHQNNASLCIIESIDTILEQESRELQKGIWMAPGRPHLYHVENSDLVLSRVIKCFSGVGNALSASQILLCTSQTSLEEVTCFLYRCCYHADDITRSLYCLVQPEHLQSHISDEILSSLLRLIRDAAAYLAIVTASTTNRWFSDLQIYHEVLSVITPNEYQLFYSKYIGKFAGNSNKAPLKPSCLVFFSEHECVGKSFEIARQAEMNNLLLIHIPFNSPKVDEEFVVDRLAFGEQQLLKALEAPKKDEFEEDKRLAFHLNISSHAGKDVNILLFKLLILRHITRSNGESFCVQPTHTFFIELPSQISTTYVKTNLDFVRKHFHFICKRTGNNAFVDERCIKMNLDNFICNEQHYFVGRYLDALDKGLLEIEGPKSKKPSWDYRQHPDVNLEQLLQLVQKFSGKKTMSIVFVKTYLDFLYRQFLVLAASTILTSNSLAVDVHKKFQKARYIQYQRVLARSFATMASSFACENYEIDNPFLIQQHKQWQDEVNTPDGNTGRMKRDPSLFLDETSGEETFSLVKKWEQADPPIAFLNPGLFNTFSTPDLEKDLRFSLHNAENAFTILSRNLDECKDPDAEEWQAFKKTIDSVKNIQTFKFDLFDFDKINEEKEENMQSGKIFADTTQKQKEKMRLLLRLCGGYRHFDEEIKTIKPIIDETQRQSFVDELYEKNRDYALTFDNILKIAAIFFRVQSGIPVLIMGETGCGKTRLLQYMADILSLRMIIVDVHGGYVLSNLVEDIENAKAEAKRLKPRTVLLFLDEINTSEEIASFKEIICDHSFKGNDLPNNLIVIGALNPYRRRVLTSQQQKIKKQDLKNNKIYYKNDFEKDMSKLVYTVYPLPPSMKRFVWNFGYIAKPDEKQYIAVITSHSWNELLLVQQRHLNKYQTKKDTLIKAFDECQPIFSNLIFLSLCWLREWLHDVSVCSLRDVRRANTFFAWFYEQFACDHAVVTVRSTIIPCMTMALAQCFYYRLSFPLREVYSYKISQQLQPIIRDFSKDVFEKILRTAQDRHLEKLIIDDGIAQNRAFKENIFVMLCGIITKTPTVVVGRPGSSKTLAMTVLEKNLSSGSNSRLINELGISEYVVQQFQCSKLTTPDAIEQYWRQCETAQNYEDAAKRVFFLDEMGLAEQSNKKPLKVLHKLLEAPDISFIGLSNWSLDSAKMNRVVLHEVAPIHTDKRDLIKTAQALAKYGPGGREVVLINNILHKIVNFYSVLVENQSNKESPFKGQFHFFGARDFYNTIAYLKFCVNSLGRQMNTQLLIEAICRNFGGLTEDQFDKYMEKLMFETLDLNDACDRPNLSTLWDEMNAIHLIRSNIIQSSSVSHNPTLSNYDMRHVMLITDSEVSWKHLYDMNVLKHDTSRVIFGSKFKNDQNSSLHLHQNIEKIKNAMSSGHTVILLHLNELYDSLYDVLNQRYLKSGVKRYSSISIRNETIRVQIDPSFRFVIVVPTTHAHHTAKDESKHTPVAFLNRLEKQYLKARDLCGQNKNWDQLLRSLEDEMENIFKDSDDYSAVFAGFVPTLTFASALIYAENIILSKRKTQTKTLSPTNTWDYEGESEEDDDKEDEKLEWEPKTPGNIVSGGNDDASSESGLDAALDSDILEYAIAVLLSNCYLRHFISYPSLDLHRNRMKSINRGRPFESINDIMEHYDKTCTETKAEFMTLIRVTTHDHFQHISDFKKHFTIRTKADTHQMDVHLSAKSFEPDDDDMKEEEDTETARDTKAKPKAILINITDIASSRELTDILNNFCIDLEYHTLIIQCTNNSNDEFLHNLHIQYLIEKVKHLIAVSISEDGGNNSKYKPKLSKDIKSGTIPHKQIISVIYMSRLTLTDLHENSDESEIAQYIQSSQFPLIFNREWKQIYCDAILPSEIKITDLNINDIYTSNIFEKRLEKHTESVIQSTFEMALNHIRFEEKMRVEVDRINKIFSNPKIDRKLKNAVIDRVKDVLKSSHNGPLHAIKRLLDKLNVRGRRNSGSKSSSNTGWEKSTETQTIMLLRTANRRRKFSRYVNRKRALAYKRIVTERGSFRQLIIKQISERMKSELVEVLVTILNHHSSQLYSPLDIDLDDQTEMKLSERAQRKFDPKMRRIWLELLKQKNIIVLVSSKLNRLQLNDRNLQIDVDTKLTVEFPFSPYINSYFHKLRREIETIALKDPYFKSNENVLIKESHETGQMILIPIIRDILRASALTDSLLTIKRFMEYYVYDLAVLELRKLFGSRFNPDYFGALVKFVQFFILSAAHQVHYKFVHQMSAAQLKQLSQAQLHDEMEDNEEDEDDEEDSESSGYVPHEQSDSETDSDGGMRMDSDSEDDKEEESDKDSDSDTSRSSYDSGSDSDHKDDDNTTSTISNLNASKRLLSASSATPEPMASALETDEKLMQQTPKDALKRQVSTPIKYPYLFHETMAALWCNERLLHEWIKIMSLLETKPDKLNELWIKYWYSFKERGLLICIYSSLNEILDFINNQFSESSMEFKVLIGMMMDTSESITYVLNWLALQQFDWQQLRELESRWDLIRLYLLCYSPFDNIKYTYDDKQIHQIKKLLKKLSDEFEIDRSFDTVGKIKFICQLMDDLCQSLRLKQNSDETQDIIQYVIQQYICSFVFHHEDFIPNEAFIYYLIDLIADEPPTEEEKRYADDDDDEIKFMANTYLKQEIASKILKLLQVHPREETKKIRVKLNDELNNADLLSVVLLRAAESHEHSKWIQKSKKKQIPTEKDIKTVGSQLSASSEQSLLNQLRVTAKCKVLIRYVVHYLDVDAFDEKYVKALSRLLNLETKQSSQSKFASLVRGLGFYFFAEFWRQKGSLDACKLRKRKKFTKILFLPHIFEPKDITIATDDVTLDTIIMNCPYKHLDDNIFNLLRRGNSQNLQSLTASKHTINKLNKTINSTLLRLRSTVNISTQSTVNNMSGPPQLMATFGGVSLSHNIIEEYKAEDATQELIDFEAVRADAYSLSENAKFVQLNEEMYDAIQKSKEMSHDLQLEKHEIVHLIGSLFNCAYLYGGKPDEKVYLWLRNQNVIPTPSRLHCLISQLLENSFPDHSLRLNIKPKKQMNLEQMMRVRLTWHLFGIAASIKQNPFFTLFCNPLHYEDGYLIGMPESQQMQLFKAMKGHHVYLCPNRHLYFVADCGATKHTSKCDQCNAIIGNAPHKRQHKAAKGNKKIGKIGENGEIISSAWGATHGTSSLPIQFLAGYSNCVGYILDMRGTNDDCVRNLSEIAVSILRCFILCMLWLHHSERSKQFPSQCLQFMASSTDNSNLSELISEKIKKYINQIRKKLGKSSEDTVYVLHAIAHKLYLTFDNFYVDRDGDKAQKDLAGRAKFEAYFMSSCVEPILQNLEISINNVRSVVSSHSFKKYWSKRVDMGFDRANDADLDAKRTFMSQYSPHLFLPFRHITISDFRAYVCCHADPQKYPVTCGIIDAMDQIGLSIFATRYIPSMVIWMKLVHQRLSGRVSRNVLDSRDDKSFEYKYNAEWLITRCKEENLGDVKKAEKALIGFVNGWNHVAKRATTQKSEVGAKIHSSSHVSGRNSASFGQEESKSNLMDCDDDEEEEKDDIKEDVEPGMEKKETMAAELEQYARYVVISHECSTVPICIIEGKDKKNSPRPADVALKLCINCIDASYEASLMIRGILDHLVHCNRTILTCCKQFRDELEDDELYQQTSDLIELTHINRDSDVVDLDQNELVRILQYCTQQSLEYGNRQTSFAMNLPLLEAQLYERYIVGRKLIDYRKHELAFVFTGHNNIKSYVDRINMKYTAANEEYFEECLKQELKDSIQLKLTIKTDRKKHKNDEEKRNYQLRIISNAKQGIEQTLIGLARWSNLPNKNMSISKFMKENLRLFHDDYELFSDFNDYELLSLKHCDGIWKLLDRLYTLKRGKWCRVPHNTPNCYRIRITNEEWRKDIKLFVNSFDKDIMWQFLMDFKDFIERILCNNDIIKHADESTLLTYFKFMSIADTVCEKFPEEIKLQNAADAYAIAAKQYQQIIQNVKI